MSWHNKIYIGVSSCILGEKVRFDGGHKKSTYVCGLLDSYFDFVSVCPEVGMGMGIPRPTIRLVGDPKFPRLVEVLKPSHDHTEGMLDYCQKKVTKLSHLSGFILKSKSPTCGLERVKVYQQEGQQPLMGQGLFAKTLTETYPLLPVEEDGRLNDFKLRENFIERLFIYHRWQTLQAAELNANALLQFHTLHKLTLLAHDEAIYRELGQLIANLKQRPLAEIADEYFKRLMQAMSVIATPKKHANVLMHSLGYLKTLIGSKDKQELLKAIDEYRLGRLPLIVPITLLKHHLMHHNVSYLQDQTYLNPYPQEMMLRNHI